MENECGKVLNMAKFKTYNAEVTFLRSPSLFGRRSCNLGISSGHMWAEEVSWNKILFEILDFQNHGDSCVSFKQSEDKINWETSNKKIKGIQSTYCGNSQPPLNQPFTTEKYNSLVIKFDAASYKDDASITFKLVVNVLHSDGHCSHYECDNGNCIPKDLKCGQYNPCGDNSHCRPDGISVKTIIFIVIGVVAGILFLILAVKYLRFKKICKAEESDSEDDGDRMAARDRDRVDPTAPHLLPHTGADDHDANNANEQRDMVDNSMLPPPSYEEVMRQGT